MNPALDPSPASLSSSLITSEAAPGAGQPALPVAPEANRLFRFSGGSEGGYRVLAVETVRGPGLESVPRLDVAEGSAPPARADCRWSLLGIVSNERYVTRPERESLVSRQVGLGRPEARHGALIPIKKSAAWWALTQDERRAIFEDRSQHIALGLRALPQVARRLHHCRDLPTAQGFDFLTWFDFHPEDTPRFDDLLGALRGSEEWSYVEREVDIRVERS
jgi:Chlorite dismutase